MRDTPDAAAACRNVAPLARAVKKRARASADFGFCSTHDLLVSVIGTRSTTRRLTILPRTG
jgi:hypothetical protein